jgi:hypothetical protein
MIGDFSICPMQNGKSLGMDRYLCYSHNFPAVSVFCTQIISNGRDNERQKKYNMGPGLTFD